MMTENNKISGARTLAMKNEKRPIEGNRNAARRGKMTVRIM
jgi:hypothetical protein